MGFFDFLGGDWGEATGNWLGTARDGLGIARAFTEGATSEGLGLGAGIASTASGLLGIGGGIANIKDGKKTDGALGIVDSLFGVGGGIADIGASSYGLKAEAESDPVKKKELLQKKGKWQKASGALGILGGLFSAGKSIRDIKNAQSTEEKVGAWTGLAGGITKIFGGIGNIGSGVTAEADEKDSKKKFWDNWGKGMSVVGAVPGLINSIMSGAKVAK